MPPILSLQRPAAGERSLRAAATAFDVPGAVEALARRLAETAVERDRLGGHAAAERALIRASGLLALTVPRELGGLGADWQTFYSAVRRLAEVDSALAHVFAFHHLQIASVLLYGSPPQRQHLLRETIDDSLFWGNALNPLDRRVTAAEAAGGWRLRGVKSFCSGSLGSDRLLVSGWHAPTQSLLIAALPTQREGVQVASDWDAFGQKQTDSGSVAFDDVFVDHDEVLVPPGAAPSTPRTTLRALVSQLIMANLYLGIAVGAFDAARRYTQQESRPWLDAGVERAVDDPFVQHRYAQLWLMVRPAILVADSAAARLDLAWRQGDELTADDRGGLAIAVSEAKLLAHRASLEVSSQVFELTGARSTSVRHGLDRFWRNARVHTLHDPADYKLRDLGRYLLDGRPPLPTSYS